MGYCYRNTLQFNLICWVAIKLNFNGFLYTLIRYDNFRTTEINRRKVMRKRMESYLLQRCRKSVIQYFNSLHAYNKVERTSQGVLSRYNNASINILFLHRVRIEFQMMLSFRWKWFCTFDVRDTLSLFLHSIYWLKHISLQVTMSSVSRPWKIYTYCRKVNKITFINCHPFQW